MLDFISRLVRRAPEAKDSRALGAVAFYLAGHPVWTARDYLGLAREGYQKNAVVHRAVRLVAEAAASLPLTLVAAGSETAEHPLLALLERPNPREGGQRFLESVYGHLLVSGNAYIEAVSVEGAGRPRRASSTRSGPTACASCPGRTAGRPPTITRSAPRRCASARTRTACRRSCT